MVTQQTSMDGDKPRKILFCIDCLVRGGTELQVIGMIERLDPKKYQPYLLTIRETDKALVPKNCQHLAWQVPKLFSLNGIKQLYKLVAWLKREKVTIVQSYFQDSTLLAGIAAKLAGTKVRVACFRDMAFWNNSKTERALNKVYPLMTGYISNAHAVSQHFAEQFGLNSKKMTVLPNGIDINKFTFIEHGSEITDICIVGNMTRQVKRTDLFIKAAAIVAKSYPQITWHIIGDGHLKAELQQLAKDLAVEQQIKFVGRIADVNAYMESMQLGVLCSDSEGLSNAILEYMLKGVVCVATEVGGTPELISDNVTGCLVKPDDSLMIAEKIIALIEQPDMRQQMAKAARSVIETHYSWVNCLAKHDQYYTDALLASKGNR